MTPRAVTVYQDKLIGRARMPTLAIALLFVGLGVWILATARWGSPWVTKSTSWLLRLLLGARRYESHDQGLEKYVHLVTVSNLWMTRILGAFFVIAGLGAFIEMWLL